jgi:hypothetical protein
MLGYKLISEYFSEDKNKLSQVFVAEQGSLYKVVLETKSMKEDFPNTRLFKIFINQEQAENAAEDWVLTNE